MQKTYMVKQDELEETSPRKWYLIDARGQTLGRLAAKIATILQGKHKPDYTPHVGMGDYVIVINAAQVRVTGRKLDQKIYYRYSGYPGGLRAKPLREVLEKSPELPLKKAVQRMLPKNDQGRRAFRRLKVYPGPDHPHQAQSPIPLQL
ncbi:MAG: 50S ribosomal protein L13 [Candidatus Bipolaricaulia bacterium]